MISNKTNEENIVVLENESIDEVTSINETIGVNETVSALENKEASETLDAKEIKETNKPKLNNDVRSKLSNLNLLSGVGIVAATATILATSVGLVNYNMSSTFNEFYYLDGRVYYEVEFDNLKDNNDLSIRLYEETKEYFETKIIYDYDQFAIDHDIYEVELIDASRKERIYLDEENTLSSVLENLGEDQLITYEYQSEENNIIFYECVTLENNGTKGKVNGYFSVNIDRIAQELSVDGEYMHYSVDLEGSVGLTTRVFDRQAIKITSLISTFNTISGECHCVTRSADGSYHVRLDYSDDYGYFDFQEIYMVDHNNNESSHISGAYSWHDEIHIPVLNLTGASDIHLIYIDKTNNTKVELIFRDSSKDIMVRYNDGTEEVFKSFEEVFDIKV